MERRRLRIEPPRPYALAHTAARYARYPEVVNRFDGETFRRLILVGGAPLRVAVTQEGTPARAVLRVELCGRAARAPEARRAALDLLERTLGTAVELRGFYRRFARDPLLGEPIRAFRGMRTAGFASLFEALVTAVLAQQVNLAFAYDIRRELCLAFGRRARIDGESWVAFPSPARLAREPETALREFRLSGSKAGALARIARGFRSGALHEESLRELEDEAVVERLCAIKGIGRWTAETALLRGLGRPDAFPAGDLGVVKYVAKGLLGRDGAAPESDMRAFSERWRPYRSLALTYCWAELTRRTEETRPLSRKRRSEQPQAEAGRACGQP